MSALTLDIADIKGDLAYLLSAANTDPTRTHLCMIRVADGRAVTTDGYRLHIVNGARFPAADLDIRTATLITNTVREIQATRLYVEGPEYRFAGSGHEVTIKAMPPDGRFPDYRNVFPKWEEVSDIFASEARKVTVVREETEVCVFTNSKGGTWHLNPRYVADALLGAGTRKSKVKVHFPADDLAPIGFEFGNRFAVVMPMRK